MTNSQPIGRLLLNATGRKLQVFYVATALLVSGAFLPTGLISESTWTLIAVGVAGLVSLEKFGAVIPGLLSGRRSAQPALDDPRDAEDERQPPAAPGAPS